jgi:HEAT repeat protein
MNENEPSLRLDTVQAASLIMKRGGIFFTADIDADFDLARKTNGLNSAEKLNGSLIPIIKKVVTDRNVASKDRAEFLASLSLLAKTYLDKLNTYTMFEEDEKLISKAKNIQATILSMMPDLIKSFESQDDLVRWSIVKLFKDYQDKAAIPVFKAGLKDSYYPVRVVSIEGLALLNHLESLGEILALLKDDVNVVRVAAVQAAIAFKATEQHESLRPLASEYDTQMRWSAAKALGSLSNTNAIPYLNSVAQSDEIFLRVIAINSLGELASEDGLETILSALKDSSPLVREAAATALTRFENIEITHKNLLELTADQNKHVRLAALKSVDFMIRGNVSEPVRKALVSAVKKLSTDEDQLIRTKSEEILKGLNK